ncbi:hypothetical protein [Pandoraea sp.]|uniref:hypothetical protein n=1 Tax=Pandoraea sp. TaxID=1883445 RepID=UPI0035B42E0B
MKHASSDRWDSHRHHKPLDPEKVVPLLKRLKTEDEIRSNVRRENATQIDSNQGKWKYVPISRPVKQD